MILEYKDDPFKFKRPKKSRAGSIRPRIEGGGKGSGYAPQAMVKVAGWANTSGSVKAMLEYISRVKDKDDREAVELENESGERLSGKTEIREMLEEWKPDFKRKSAKAVKAPRHAVHLIFSAKAELDRSNIERTLRAARRTLKQHFADKGYRFAVGVHQDGKFPHVHAVVKTVSEDDQQTKLRLGPKELFKVRKTLAEELTREGLTHEASRQPSKIQKKRPSIFKGDRPDILKRTEAVVGNLKKEQRQFERRLNRENPSVNAFEFRRRQTKTLDTLRDGVDKDSSLVDHKRLKAFGLIREFRRDLKKKPLNEELAVTATLNHFMAKHEKWSRQVRDTDKILEQPLTTKARTEAKDTMKDLAESGSLLAKNMESFLRTDLKMLNLPTERKKELHRQVRGRFQDLRKTLDRVQSRSR